jgi:Nucleotidyl transferase AbiEii toxin, Type IV TA system
VTKKVVTNFAASVHARLLAVTQQRNADFHHTLQRYVAERFLYRLGLSSYCDRFVLKGAMLFVLWEEAAVRPTKDLDLAGYVADDVNAIARAFREIASIPSPRDGLDFALHTLEITPIRDLAEYRGFRMNLDVHLGRAVIPFQVDVAFGDVIVPAPSEVVYPVLLDGESPHVRAYPREAVVAEKLHAMVLHGGANSRYKDFFDIDRLSARFAFEGATLVASISATFSRRGSADLTTWPVALTTGFYADPGRSDQWRRFLSRMKLEGGSADFAPVGARVIAFLESPVRAVSKGEPFARHWRAGGPWR